jgi:pilus assembly protein CpaB
MENAMKKLVLLALIISIITGFAVFQFAASVEKGPKEKTQTTVIAVKGIPKGTVILPEMITTKEIPVDYVNALAVGNINDVTGRITKENIEANEQILTSRLSDASQDNDSLAYVIPSNYRAMTIQTDEITGVAGFVSKGDRVDILATMLSGGTASSQFIAENVEVLAVGSKIKQSKNEEYVSVTVAVPVELVSKVSYALTEGKCRIVLRSAVDKTAVNPAPFVP